MKAKKAKKVVTFVGEAKEIFMPVIVEQRDKMAQRGFLPPGANWANNRQQREREGSRRSRQEEEGARTEGKMSGMRKRKRMSVSGLH